MEQGVRQGGILSAYHIKIFVDPLLHTLTSSSLRIGERIGLISCVAPTCADDMLLASKERAEAQAMVITSGGFSQRHGYKLQAEKSVIIGGQDTNEDDGFGNLPVEFHGNNGVDPATCIHLLKIYVVPVLTYDWKYYCL